MRKTFIRFLVCSIFVFSSIFALGSYFTQAAKAKALATTHYVSADGNCGAPAPCYLTIQEAVDNAAEGDTVKIAQGTYTITAAPPSNIVTIDKGLTVIGGFAVTDWDKSDPESYPTILNSQNIAQRRAFFVSAPANKQVHISGVTMKGSRGGTTTLDKWGGGAYIESGQVTIRDCVVSENYSLNTSGIFIQDGVVEISNCKFFNNSNPTAGGTISIERGNVAILDNTIQENRMSQAAAGVQIRGGTVTVKGNLFDNNNFGVPNEDGGGTQGISAKGGNVTIDGNTFKRNQGTTTIYLATQTSMINNIFEDNFASYVILIENESSFSTGPNEIILKNNQFKGNRGGTVIDIWEGPAMFLENLFDGNSPDSRSIVNIRYQDGAEENVAIFNENRFINNFTPDSGVIGIAGGKTKLKRNYFRNNGLNLRFPIDYAGQVITVWRGEVESENDIFVDNVTNRVVPEASAARPVIWIRNGSFFGKHITMANNSDVAIENLSGFVELQNSIIANHPSGAFLGPNIISNHNLFFGNPACSPSGSCTNSIVGDPAFLDSSNGDFRITKDSAAIDVGVNLGVLTDAEGDFRPSGDGVDVGADEYSCGGLLNSLQVTDRTSENGTLTAMLRWNTPADVTEYEIRMLSEPVTDQNWDQASVLASSLPNDTTSYEVSVPHQGDNLFFAIRYSTNSCGNSQLSTSSLWLNHNIYLPLVSTN